MRFGLLVGWGGGFRLAGGFDVVDGMDEKGKKRKGE